MTATLGVCLRTHGCACTLAPHSRAPLTLAAGNHGGGHGRGVAAHVPHIQVHQDLVVPVIGQAACVHVGMWGVRGVQVCVCVRACPSSNARPLGLQELDHWGGSNPPRFYLGCMLWP